MGSCLQQKDSMRWLNSSNILKCHSQICQRLSVWDLSLIKKLLFASPAVFLYSSIRAEKVIQYLFFFSLCLQLKTDEVLYSPPHLVEWDIKVVLLILILLVCAYIILLNKLVMWMWKDTTTVQLGEKVMGHRFRHLQCLDWNKEEFYSCL